MWLQSQKNVGVVFIVRNFLSHKTNKTNEVKAHPPSDEMASRAESHD